MPLKTIGPGITSQDHNDNNAYLQGLIFGQDDKLSVRAATTANIVLSGTQTIDGVVLVVGDRVLVKNQATASQNGPYVVAAGAWTRATDADASGEVTSGMMIRVNEGTANAGSEWFLSTPDPIVIDTTALTFTQADGLLTITDTTVANASPGRIATLVSMLGNMIKQITGEASWPIAPVATLRALKTTANLTLYVDTVNGNDTNDGLAAGAGRALKTIMAAINKIPQIVNHTVTVNAAAGTYAEDVVIAGFAGKGQIALNGSNVVGATHTIQSLTISQCIASVTATGLNISTTTKDGVVVSNSNFVILSKLNIVAAAPANAGVAVSRSAGPWITECTISSKNYGIFLNYGSSAVSETGAGTGNSFGLLSYGSVIYKSGSQPAGTTAESTSQGGKIY